MPKKDTNRRHFDYIIVGAGPAGLQLGYFFQKHNYNYVIIEKTHQCGAFFDKFPIHQKLISINKVHTGSDDAEFNLRHDWNSLLTYEEEPFLFKEYSEEYFPNSKDYVKYLNDFKAKFNINVSFNTCVNKISKKNNTFTVSTHSNITFSCENMIVGTGYNNPTQHYAVKSEKYNVVDYADLTLDKEQFKNKNILILGLGNSGFETANYLLGSCAIIHMASIKSDTKNSHEDKKMSYTSHYPGDLRSVNATFLDSYLLKSQNVIIGNINENGVEPDENNAICLDKEIQDGIKRYNNFFDYDFIINCSGFGMDKGIFDKTIGIELARNKIPKIDSKFQCINCENLYFIGTMSQFLDLKKSSGAFIHGFRYLTRALFHIFQNEKFDKEWSSDIIRYDNMCDYIIKRLNSSSSIYQNFGGFMSDFFFVFTDENDIKSFKYIKDVPINYVPILCKKYNTSKIINVSLEYGAEPFKDSPFNGSPITLEEQDAHNSIFLHPIFTVISGDKIAAKLHILENYNNIWGAPDNEEHYRIVKEPISALIYKFYNDEI